MQPKLEIPLALAPEGVTKFRRRDPISLKVDDDPALDALESGLTFAETRARELSDIVSAVSGDPTVTSGAAAAKIRAASLKIGEAAAKKLDDARAGLEREIAAIGKATFAPAPPANQVEHQLETEIRARFASMTDSARKAAWADAMKGDDADLVAGALLRAPAMLSGMGPAELEIRRDGWRRKRFPAETDREGRLRRALEAAERAGKSLVKFIEGVADGPGGEAEAAARHAAEMLAAAEAAE